jgi:hypothetical protein
MARRPLCGIALACAVLLLGACGGEEKTPTDASGHAAADPHPVAGNFKPNETDFADCEPEDFRCLEQAFGNLAYEEGPKEAMALFDEKLVSDRAIEANCHRIVHTIGSASLARFDGNVPKAFALGSSSCWSGYYHGILERAFTGVSSLDGLGEAAREICDGDDIRRTTFLYYQCVHGLGHGLMIRSAYDLPFSLKVCDKLATDWDQTACTGGVFMENISSTYGVKSKWIKEDDPVYPCQTVKERHKLYCYLMVTSRINELNGYDWKKTSAVCRGVEENWVTTCFESYGRDASGFTRQNPRKAARLCSFAKGYAGSCLYGAARDMTSNYANGVQAGKLCSLGPLGYRAQCFFGIGTIVGDLHPTKEARRDACAQASPRRFFPNCMTGAGSRAPVSPETPA